MNEKGHQPVLLREALDFLDVSRAGTYIDCTLGLGGHAAAILEANPEASLIGFDLDELSILEAKKRLGPYSERIQVYHSDFRYLPDLNLDFSRVKGILLDLGMSSFQLDSPERGFSYTLQGPLDMRMDFRSKITAARILHHSSEARLAELFRDYGELKQAKILARRLVALRKINPFQTTTDLRRIVEDVCRWRPQKGKIHPAAKVFQALRIEVNQELKGLSSFLEKVTHLMPAETRIVVISFHSLEDRIVKRTFAHLAKPEDGPPLLRLLTKKPIPAAEEEVGRNFRARSAKLRAAETI